MAAICKHGNKAVECLACDREYAEDADEPGAEWDWDRNDARQYCRHGTFIGSWWGPDLLCWRCEMGDEYEDEAELEATHG